MFFSFYNVWIYQINLFMTVHIYSFVFLFLYNVFFFFLFFFGFLLSLFLFVILIWSHYYCCYYSWKKMLWFLVFGDFFFFFFKEVIICWSDPACVHRAELACGPTNQCIAVHVNNQDSIFKKAWVNIISCLRSLWSAFDHENPRKRYQGYVDINCDTELRVLHQNILPICSQLGYKS